MGKFRLYCNLIFFRLLYHKTKPAGRRAGRTKDHILYLIRKLKVYKIVAKSRLQRISIKANIRGKGKKKEKPSGVWDKYIFVLGK